MPWTLAYPDNIDGRIARNVHRFLFNGSPDVESTSVLTQGGLRLVVSFRDEWAQTENPDLRRVYDTFGYERQAVWSPPQPAPQQPRLHPDGVPPEVQSRISEYLATPTGRTRLAQSMAAPLRQRLDYQGVARRAFLVEQLPPGALPTYDRPLWVAEGVWAFNKERDEYIQVIQRLPGGVRIKSWRSPEPDRFVDVDYLYENWEPCAEPAEPLPFWDRLGEDDLSP